MIPHIPGDPAPCCMGYFPNLPPTPPPLGIDLTIPGRAPATGPQRQRPSRAAGGPDGQYGCLVPVDGKKRCPQCWRVLAWPVDFGYAGNNRKNCIECRGQMKSNAKPDP